MDWIEYIRSDENAALKQIYTDYRQSCLQWLKSTLNIGHEDGVEIFQMSVIILYDNIKKGKLESLTGNLKSYLFSIARNKSLELHRKYKREIRQDEMTNPLVSYIIEDEIVEKENLEERINTSYRALQLLGDPCKTLLKLYYYKSMKMEDISKLMGYKNASTTKNQKYKCIKRLQNIYSTHKLKKDSIG